MFLPVLALLGTIALIYWLGTGRFGRAQTQAWIDHLRNLPALYNFLNRHHGKFRAMSHYVEFGGLFLVLYWLYDAVLGSARWEFRVVPSIIIAVICMIAAYLDEMHQLRSGTRQFRRVDFLHSCCGISIAILLVELQAIARGV